MQQGEPSEASLQSLAERLVDETLGACIVVARIVVARMAVAASLKCLAERLVAETLGTCMRA